MDRPPILANLSGFDKAEMRLESTYIFICFRVINATAIFNKDNYSTPMLTKNEFQ